MWHLEAVFRSDTSGCVSNNSSISINREIRRSLVFWNIASDSTSNKRCNGISTVVVVVAASAAFVCRCSSGISAKQQRF